MSIVFLFPGQSSRYPGMLSKLAELHPANRQLLAQASERVGRCLASHYVDGNDAAFARNEDVQIGVFLANHMFLTILEEAGVRADYSMGLSLGEYNHLVHIGALSFEDGIDLVRARGQAYDAGPRGIMASCFPISYEDLAQAIAEVNPPGLCEIVNLNSPKQQVISGDKEAVEAVVAHLEEEYFVNPVVIERQVPMHASSFEPVSHSFASALADAPFQVPALPYLPNRTAELEIAAQPALFRRLLAEHVSRPVLWRQSIDVIVDTVPEAVFVEVGPMAVLYNLMSRKWVKNRKFKTDTREDTGAHLSSVVDELLAVPSAARSFASAVS